MTNAAQPAILPDFLAAPALRLIVFGGKGGVGKTTCACAAALTLARSRPGDRFTLVSTDPAHSVADALAVGALPANLEVVELDAAAEHAAFMGEHQATLAELAKRGTFLDAEDIDALVRLSLPGVDEVMAFLRLARWAQEDPDRTIVVDTAPTGHALRLLQMPALLDRWLEVMDALMAKHRYMAGLFGARAKRDRCEDFLSWLTDLLAGLKALITDSARCHFVPVMLAETLSVAETDDLLASLAEIGIAAPDVVVNRLIPTGSDAGPLGLVRAEQARQLGGVPDSIRSRRVWGLTMRAAEVRGPDALAELYADLMTPAALGAWRAAPTSPNAGTSEAPRVVGEPAAIADAERCRLIVVAGKGGVGKTTIACATAGALAQSRPTLVISTDPAHSLGDCLGLKLSDSPTVVAPNLTALELDAAAEFDRLREAYRDEVEHALDALLGGMDLAFDRDVLEGLLDLAPPGMDELMALVRVVELLDKPGAGGSPLVVLDTAPTGHTLRLLEMPELIEGWLSTIFRVLLKHRAALRLPRLEARLVELSKGVKRLRALLRDPASSRVVPVAIPTALALEETIDFVRRCRALGVQVGTLMVNLATPAEWAAQDPLAHALVEREARVLADFASRLGDVPRCVLTRGRAPRGIDELRELGLRAFAAPGVRARRAA